MPETVKMDRGMIQRALLMLDNIQVAKGNDNVTRLAWVITWLQAALNEPLEGPETGGVTDA